MSLESRLENDSMRIALLADTFSVEKGTGIARYSQEMLKGLRSKGLYVEPMAPEAPTMPLGVTINHALRMPYIVSRKTRHFDLIHATSPVTALCFPVIQQPTVVTYWDLVSLLCQNTSSAFHTRLFAPLFLRIGRFADAIIASSSQTKEEMIAHLGLPRHRISVVNPGIAEVFRPTNRPARGPFVIGYVGAFDRRKGVDYLFRSFSVLRAEGLERGTKLMLCGRRTLEYSALVQLVKDLDIDGDVEFRGFVSGESLPTAYNSFDVFVLPSEWEGFGLPILEAQRCGVPVIIREHAHIPQEVSKCCLKATSEEDMADKISEVLTNAALREAVIDQGLEYSKEFTWERTVRETLKVYEEALS